MSAEERHLLDGTPSSFVQKQKTARVRCFDWSITMKQFLLGALTMGAFLVLVSFAFTVSSAPISQVPIQETSHHQAASPITVSYLHDPQTHAAFVWEWKGNEPIGMTRYAWVNGVLTKHRFGQAEEKK